MQQRRVDIDERHASERADESDEAIEIAGAGDRHEAADGDDGGAEGVLAPLGDAVGLAGAVAEEARLEDADGGEELDGGADEDGEGVEELDGVDERVGLREVGDQLRHGGGAKGGVAEGADGREDERYEEHDEVEERGELVGLGHG